MRPRAFTLLEAVIALALLAAAAIVCLQLRTQSLTRGRKLDELRRRDDTARQVLDLAVAGLLPGGVGPDAADPARRIEWKGVHNGLEFTCTRRSTEATNPVQGDAAPAGAALAPTIDLDRWVVVCAGVTVERLEGRRP